MGCWRLSSRGISKLRTQIGALQLSLLIVVLSTSVLGQERGIPEGPTAYIGHGAMFDREGNEIAPSAEVIGQAQSLYIDQVLQLADEDQRQRHRELEAEIAQGVALDGQAKLVVDLRLLDWLIDKFSRPRRSD